MSAENPTPEAQAAPDKVREIHIEHFGGSFNMELVADGIRKLDLEPGEYTFREVSDESAAKRAMEALRNAFIAMGRQGANADLNHPLRKDWEAARAVLSPSTPESLTGPQALHAAEVMRAISDRKEAERQVAIDLAAAISERETVVLPRPALDWVTLGDFRDSQGHPLRNNLDFQALLEAVTKAQKALRDVLGLIAEWDQNDLQTATVEEMYNIREVADDALSLLDNPSLVAAVKAAGGSHG